MCPLLSPGMALKSKADTKHTPLHPCQADNRLALISSLPAHTGIQVRSNFHLPYTEFCTHFPRANLDYEYSPLAMPYDLNIESQRS